MTFEDTSATPATTYTYRLRVETSTGLSTYSGEVSVTTSAAVPPAPTGLQATAISSTEVALTWTNPAGGATSVRVEMRQSGSAAFVDIGPAPTLTATTVTNLQPNASYTFRVRAQNAAGFSTYSHETSVTTFPAPKTVFLIHGLRQAPAEMKTCAQPLKFL
jgi:hypothetical protein